MGRKIVFLGVTLYSLFLTVVL